MYDSIMRIKFYHVHKSFVFWSHRARKKAYYQAIIPAHSTTEHPMNSTVLWLKYEKKDCFTGFGADYILPDPYSSYISLSDCQNACETDDSCEGIIVESGAWHQTGQCRKRRNIKLGECQDYDHYDLFIKSTAGKQKMMHNFGGRNWSFVQRGIHLRE